ncbi:MAG: hypothetical protein COW34_01975 [Armatimonadetes bacterium CG17_big_fil_post_rev_8_21_14_2_50_66_6]|nr:hypothetical protein [Armatimonadota bacterium]PIW20373.1 MAG: hypothetical protein COW34_01975 [Armatimonadetes bacterium CG17_big_fil_post_rev_8_21_14_2_50_66_6]
MKVFVCTDIEGVAGVVTFESDSYPDGKYFEACKKAKTKACVAMKALASKWSKACYFIMRDQAAFQIERVFG